MTGASSGKIETASGSVESVVDCAPLFFSPWSVASRGAIVPDEWLFFLFFFFFFCYFDVVVKEMKPQR